jgi:hypothetical protein
MSLTKTSELEAVNIMLATIGEAPVNTLTGSVTADVGIAQNILTEVSKDVQTSGWNFNTDYDFEMSPSSVDKKIAVSGDIVRLDMEEKNVKNHMDIIVREGFVYDKYNQTFEFDEAIKLTIVRLYDFDQLPQPARTYIVKRAARIFNDRMIGSGKHHDFALMDERQALFALRDFDGESSDHTIFDHYDTYRAVDRRGVAHRVR